MEYIEVENVLYDCLQQAEGRFRSAYQICKFIEKEHPVTWKRLLSEYPSEADRPDYGENAGIYYSPASFVAKALSYFENKEGSNIRKEWLDSTDVRFEDTDPGNKSGWLSIWAWNVLNDN